VIAYNISERWRDTLARLALRLLLSLTGVAIVTYAAHKLVPVNATTVGFAYLVLVLLIASTWGFVESALASIAATLTFNFFFLPPVSTFTIADPQNWIALFSFLTTSLIASRLSTEAKRRALDAIERQQDVERLYTFSRAILLIDTGEPIAKQLALKLAEVFQLSAAVLYERRTGEFSRAGPSDFEGLDDQLRDAALHGTSFSDAQRNRIMTAVRLGSEPIASLALQGPSMPDSVLQGIANLVAIGLERAKAQEFAHQIEAAKQSEQLRTTLIDAMAHEFKTPLTSIRAATTSLLSVPDQSLENRTELLRIADEEAEHLRVLIDDAVEMARLDTPNIEVHLERSNLGEIVRDLVASMQKGIDDRPLEVVCDAEQPAIPIDQRLVKVAIKQLLDNALKYSAPGTPVTVQVRNADGMMTVDITDQGKGIPPIEQARVFERFYRSPSVKKQMPGSGLGLSIAHGIAHAHHGDLTVTSRPGETTFRLTLPTEHKGDRS
jgi:two-component system, OmpR family, sensor histidine kinase KdpD